MEYQSGGGGSGGGGGGGGGGDNNINKNNNNNNNNDGSEAQRRNKKRYHRHTTLQISKLEGMFKECPHPDEKQRLHLSRELGLAPRQIKFWFQNRRTQMKAQHERADNCALRSENDKIRCENIAIREALKNVICPSCGGPPINEDSYFDEQKLRIENAQLKEELDRVSSIAAKYIGRPISQLPPVQPIHISSLDLSMASFGSHHHHHHHHGHHHGLGLGLDLDLIPGAGLSAMLPAPQMGYYQPQVMSDMDKSLMTEIASGAMEELLRLLQSNDPLWIKAEGRDVLNLDAYERMFPRANSHGKSNIPNLRFEASRDSGVVIMNGLALVDMFMDPNKWVELFPTIVTMARMIEVISPGVLGSHSGTLHLMHEELQVLSPFVPTREFYFLRYCQLIEQGMWAIVDVSYDFPRDSQFAAQFRSHRLPSGVLIQDMPNGYSKVTWVEHVEIEDKAPTHRLYRDLIHSGLAFGAERWLSTLQRMCERFACFVSATSTRDLGGVIPSPEGRRSLMKLAQRMVSNFSGSVSASNGHRWTSLSGQNEVGVRVTVHKSSDPGQTNGLVLSAATTIWLPVSPQDVFNFFKDERTRPQWDALSNGNAVEEVFHLANGSHPGNCISVFRAFNTSQNNMLILQESSIDSSGSVVVYCPVDLHSINTAMSGEDPSYIPLLPSGFTITSAGGPSPDAAAAASTSSVAAGASLVTVAFQILVSSVPSAKLNLESVNTVNNLIGTTVHQIKAALNCPTSS